MNEPSHNLLRDVLTSDAIDQMNSNPVLKDLTEFIIDNFDCPVDPKTGLRWAKPFFQSPMFRSWLMYDQLSFDPYGSELDGFFDRDTPDTDIDQNFVSVFIDGDRWKQINYTYGHDGGDEAIVSLAGTVKSIFRPQDYVLRMGGDEFVVLVKNIPDERLETFETSIKSRLGNLALSISGNTVPGSATAGFAHCDMSLVRSEVDGYIQARNTIVLADNAMVAAKQQKVQT